MKTRFALTALTALAPLLVIAACSTTEERVHTPRVTGMEALIGKPASAATAMLGAPALDRTEGPARQLQFQGVCVLDLYYYGEGSGEKQATYAAAREPNGRDMDPASCLGALSRQR